MSFQACLDNIRAKTGKTPDQLKALAVNADVFSSDMKASALVAWLKKEFDLGHGHSAVEAIYLVRGVRTPQLLGTYGLQPRRRAASSCLVTFHMVGRPPSSAATLVGQQVCR